MKTLAMVTAVLTACAAVLLPSSGASAQSSNCCVAHPGPGCDNPQCQQIVCGILPLCCFVSWDAGCADMAQNACGPLCAGGPSPCGGLDAGDCCVASGIPGCADASCCNSICPSNPFCCDVSWDQICADQAHQVCLACGAPSPCGGPASQDCCLAHGAPGCHDLDCCDTVCAQDPYCCNFAWDQLCADAAGVSCGGLCSPAPCPAQEECCSAHPSPGCDDVDCCQAVCAQLPLCCVVAWDEPCAIAARKICPVPGATEFQQVVKLLDSSIALTNTAIAQVQASIAHSDQGITHTDLAKAETQAAQASFTQARQLALQCGACGLPAQTHFDLIDQNLAGCFDQLEMARFQKGAARAQKGLAEDHLLRSAVKQIEAQNQMLGNPPDVARAEQKIADSDAQVDQAKVLKKRAKDEESRAFLEELRAWGGKKVIAQFESVLVQQLLAACGPCANQALAALATGANQLNMAMANIEIAIQETDGACQGFDGACTPLRASIASDEGVTDLLDEALGLLRGCEPGPCPTNCSGDDDNNTGVVDFLTLLSQWGQVGTSCDINGDGVNVIDLLTLLANWGPCPVCPLPPPPADLCAPIQHVHCRSDLPFDRLCVPLVVVNGPGGVLQAVECVCIDTLGGVFCGWINAVAPRIVTCAGSCLPPEQCRVLVTPPGGPPFIEQFSQHFTNPDPLGTTYQCTCAP